MRWLVSPVRTMIRQSCVDVCLPGSENSSESGARVISQQDLSPSLPRRRRAAAAVTAVAAAGPPRSWTATPPLPPCYCHRARVPGRCRRDSVAVGLCIAGSHRPGLDCVIRHWRERAGGGPTIGCDRGVT
jgi:hypothetical protein